MLTRFTTIPKTTHLHLLGLFVLASGFRLWTLRKKNLWLDEGHTVRVATNRDLWAALLDTAHPSLHYLFVRLQIQVMGNDEIALRLSSVVAGVGSVLILYFLASYLFTARVGFFAGVLLSVSNVHVEFSQEIRMYVLFGVFVLLSYYTFIRILLQDEVRWHKTVWVIATVAMMYTHYYGVFVVLSQILTVVALNRSLLLRELPTAAVATLLYVPGAIVLFEQSSTVRSGFVSGADRPITLLLRSPAFAAGDYYSVGGSRLISMIILAVFGFLFASGVFVLLYRALSTGEVDGVRSTLGDMLPSDDTTTRVAPLRSIVVLSLWGGSIYLIPYIIGLFVRFPMKRHYTFAGLVPVLLFIAVGADEWLRKLTTRFSVTNRGVLVAGTALLLLVSLPGTVAYYQSVPESEYRATAEVVESEYETDDMVFFYYDSIRAPFCWYTDCDNYDVRYGEAAWPHTGGYYDSDRYITAGILEPRPTAEMLNYTAGYDTVWYVAGESPEQDLLTVYNESDQWTVERVNTGSVSVFALRNRNSTDRGCHRTVRIPKSRVNAEVE